MKKGNTRSDKKFGVKVWVKTIEKDLFRTHCFRYHLSMMFVAEKYVKTCLEDLPDVKLEEIIEARFEEFNSMGKSEYDYEVLGFKIKNEYWQKLAYFAVLYKTSVAKIASCIFDYALESYELRNVEEQHGLTFTYNKKRRFAGRTHNTERMSDY